jgi:hypothetical protein
MAQTRIYAFTDDAGREAFSKIALDEVFQDMRLISYDGLHALTGHEPQPWPWQDRARQTATRLIHYHRILGEVVKRFNRAIPASFESVFDYPAAVPQALARHQRDILDLLARYGQLRQFSLDVKWDVSIMQQLMKKFPKAAGLSTLDKERKILRDQLLLHLQGRLRDLIILDDNNPAMVLKSVLLIEAYEEDNIANLLEAIDRECQGRLDIRLTGPMPACNFARVEMKLPDRARVRQARADLGIGFSERLSEVKNAYRRKVKALHPDHGAPKEHHELMTRLTRSYRYLTGLAAQQNSQTKIDPDKQWLRCDPETLKRTPLLHIQRGISHWDNAVIRRT